MSIPGKTLLELGAVTTIEATDRYYVVRGSGDFYISGASLNNIIGVNTAILFLGNGDGIVINDVDSIAGSPTIFSATSNFTSADAGKSATLYAKHQNFACSFTSGDATVTTASTTNLVAGMRVSAAKTVETTGAITGNGTTISSLGTTTGLLVGMIVSGNGIAGGATIVSINTGASSMVISVSSDRTAAGVGLAFAMYIVPLDATILSITNATTFELSSNAMATSAALATDFAPSYLLTTIISVTDANHVTLNNNALATVSGGRMIYGTDKTSVIQNALDSLYDAGGGIIQFGSGLFIIAGALQDASVRNAVILVPNNNDGSQVTSLTMIGTGTPAMESNGFLDYPPSLTGTVIFCPTPASGTNPCMFSGNNSATPGSLSSITFRCEQLTFRRPQASFLGELNFLNAGSLILEYCVIEPDYSTVQEFLMHSYPSAQVGAVFPNSNNGGFCKFSNSRILGAGTAIAGSQHTCISNVEISACRIGVSDSADGGGGIIRITNCHFVGCGYNFYVPDSMHTACFMGSGIVFENYGVGPYINIWDFYDVSGVRTVGDVNVALLTSDRVRISTTEMQVACVYGTNREVINPLPISLSGSQRFVLKQSRTGGAPGFEIQDATGAVIGYVIGFPDFGGQFIMQGGTDFSTFVRNSSSEGMTISPHAALGKATVPKLNVSSIPTSASGLSSGDVWSNSGVLTIVA